MKTLAQYPTHDIDEFRYVTLYGVFTKRLTTRGYSIHTYLVSKVAGEWPDKKALMAFCDNRAPYFGGSVTTSGDIAIVKCYIN